MADDLWKKLRRSAQNAMELVRLGRLTDSDGVPFEVRDQGTHHKLRRYRGRNLEGAIRGPILLVPPLMLTSEVYDMGADISSVRTLLDAGLDVWVCDFGAPEKADGGLARTLDDHILAVDACIEVVASETGLDVHLAGYSQGGMFCYQAAAYRRSKQLASVITFGAPVDIHRNLPNVDAEAVSELARLLQSMLKVPLDELEGLPGFLTSTGFKVLSLRKEVGQIADFFAKLHDRGALERREGRRRFLGGEGFVAWPGPAFRAFVEEFIVHNRLLTGGFVIDGRSVSLSDVTCPVLYFVGTRDDLARPAAVRAVRRAVASEELYERSLQAGHFGLVVGSRALRETWPTVVRFIRWQSDGGPMPIELRPEPAPATIEDAAFAGENFDVRLVVDVAKDVLRSAWNAVGDLAVDAGAYAENVRWQLPRLSTLEDLSADSRVSFSRALAKQAEDRPDEHFFLWSGRAFSFRNADERVNNVVKGLWHVGVRPGDRVAILMHARPSLLTGVGAITRLGATAVVLPSDGHIELWKKGADLAGVTFVLTSPEFAKEAATMAGEGTVRDVLILGGGRNRILDASGVVDMEQIDVEGVELPGELELDALRGRDTAIIFVSEKNRSRFGEACVKDETEGQLTLRRVDGHRWAMSAYGAAAACNLTPRDTVFNALPLDHMSGLVVAVGSALVSGCRIALARDSERFPLVGQDSQDFWRGVRRYGASVVYYASDSARGLVTAPFSPRENENPVRVFAGSAASPFVWRELRRRFDVQVVEFYASTEVSAIFANTSGEKIGSVGTPLVGSAEMLLLQLEVDPQNEGQEPNGSKEGSSLRNALGRVTQVRRDRRGLCRKARADEPGLLVVKLDGPIKFNPREGAEETRLLRDVLREGDVWYSTRDVLMRDEAGDHYFVGTLGETLALNDSQEVRGLREIERAADEIEGVLSATLCATGEIFWLRIHCAGTSRDQKRILRDVERAIASLPAPLNNVDVELINEQS